MHVQSANPIALDSAGQAGAHVLHVNEPYLKFGGTCVANVCYMWTCAHSTMLFHMVTNLIYLCTYSIADFLFCVFVYNRLGCKLWCCSHVHSLTISFALCPSTYYQLSKGVSLQLQWQIHDGYPLCDEVLIEDCNEIGVCTFDTLVSTSEPLRCWYLSLLGLP